MREKLNRYSWIVAFICMYFTAHAMVTLYFAEKRERRYMKWNRELIAYNYEAQGKVKECYRAFDRCITILKGER